MVCNSPFRFLFLHCPTQTGLFIKIITVLSLELYKKYLKRDQTDWLLGRYNPFVRYFTLKELLDLNDSHPEVIKARQKIMKSMLIKMLLADQHQDGHWGEPGWIIHFPNTAGRLWLLAYLGADREHPKIQKAIDYLLDRWMQDIYHDKTKKYIRISKGWPSDWGFETCMHGWSLFALLRFGNLHDQRIQKMINWIARYTRCDDGDRILPEGLQNAKLCQGKHTCIWGTIALLEAFSEIPFELRNKKVQKTLDNLAKFVLIHHINKRSHDLSRYLNPKLNQLGAAHHQDFVTILTALTKSGYYDERMQNAVSYLIRKQTKEGKWKLQRPIDKFGMPFGKRGEPSKWVTLRAMIALRMYFNIKDSLELAEYQYE